MQERTSPDKAPKKPAVIIMLGEDRFVSLVNKKPAYAKITIQKMIRKYMGECAFLCQKIPTERHRLKGPPRSRCVMGEVPWSLRPDSTRYKSSNTLKHQISPQQRTKEHVRFLDSCCFRTSDSGTFCIVVRGFLSMAVTLFLDSLQFQAHIRHRVRSV